MTTCCAIHTVILNTISSTFVTPISLKSHMKLTFDVSNDDHDEQAVVVGMMGVVNAGCDLTSADDFLQGDQHQFDGQERHAFIEEVQWAVKDEVPENMVENKTLEGGFVIQL